MRSEDSSREGKHIQPLKMVYNAVLSFDNTAGDKSMRSQHTSCLSPELWSLWSIKVNTVVAGIPNPYLKKQSIYNLKTELHDSLYCRRTGKFTSECTWDDNDLNYMFYTE